MPPCQNGIQTYGVGSHLARPKPQVNQGCHRWAVKRIAQGRHPSHLLFEGLTVTFSRLFEESLGISFTISHQAFTFISIYHSLLPSGNFPHQELWFECIWREHHVVFSPQIHGGLITLPDTRRLRGRSASRDCPRECGQPSISVKLLSRPLLAFFQDVL